MKGDKFKDDSLLESTVGVHKVIYAAGLDDGSKEFSGVANVI